ncbi:tyrosine-type recombinase/integrase [Amycolatopsis sp. lyj-109]|uniref:tyrosine-type recombinase/integrase n=1 Tax=Amycolatopsis sp. lyj-109 TaxID=2789287 RepID=UPI003978122A
MVAVDTKAPSRLVSLSQIAARGCPVLSACGRHLGTELDAHNVRRGFRKVVKAAGLVPEEWTPREMRHSFVSLLSDARVPIEDIARLCGHSGTVVTEQVYRHQIRPVIVEGALAMESIFPARGGEAQSPS